MRRVLKLLLILCITSTSLALDKSDRDELRFRTQYQQTLESLPKLDLQTPLDLTLPRSQTPYTDFVTANEAFYSKHLLVIRWLSGQTQHPLSCAGSSPQGGPSESAKAQADREHRSLLIGQDGLRNFDIAEYVTKVPGFKDCGLTTAESAAIYDYTNSFYKTLNTALRKKQASKDIEAYTETLDRALNKLAAFEGWVKRGTNFSASVRAKYVKGAIVSDLAYTSTTLGNQFSGDDQLHIYSKTGRYIAPLSANHNEEEVLFRRNTDFEVIDVWTDREDPHIKNYKLIEHIPHQ